MKYLNYKNDAVMSGAERQSLTPTDEPDFLEDRPRGRCCWCRHRLGVSFTPVTGDRVTFCGNVDCKDWHDWETEDENRIRYAAGRLEEAKIEERVNRELARRGE